jgi:hypothetical protein
MDVISKSPGGISDKLAMLIESSLPGEILSGQALTLTQVQEKYDASRSTVYRWRYDLPEERRLHQVKIRSHVRVYESQLEDFIRRNNGAPTT